MTTLALSFSTTKDVTVKIKSIYGEMKAYPIGNDAQTFADIAGTKTLTAATLRHIAKLGYAIHATSETGHYIGEYSEEMGIR